MTPRRHRTLAALALLMLGACPPPPVPKRPVARRAPLPTTRFVPPEAYRQFILSELAAGRGDAAGALRHLRLALAEDPDAPYLRVRVAELLHARGDTRQALVQVRLAERASPGYAESFFVHGRLLAFRRPRVALRLLARAIRLDRSDGRAYLWQARVRLWLGDARGERAAFARLLEVRPQSVEALFGLARARARIGDLEGACKLLRRITVVRPFAVRPRLLLARLRIHQKKYGAAVQALLLALEASADDPVVARELFRLYRIRGQRRQARDLVKLMEVHASASYLVFVAALYDAMLDEPRARRAVERALHQDPDFGPAVAFKARLLARQQGLAPALRLLRKVGAASRAFVSARSTWAELLEGEGRRAEALRVLTAALRSRPRSPDLHEKLALVRARAGQLGAALRELALVARLRSRASGDADQRYLKALVLDEGARFGAARRIARELIREDPDDAQPLNLLGYGLAARGIGLKRAVALLERARRLDPLSPYILDSLGWARYRQGRLRSAVTLLRAAARADGRLHEPWAHLGDALAALGRRTAARRAYRRALSRRPPASQRAVIRGKLLRLMPGRPARGKP